MRVGRRQFLEVASAAGAGCMFHDRRDTASSAQPKVTLYLTLWGSALYAFSADGTTVEVAYLLNDPQIPGLHFMPHAPRFEVINGAFVAGESTFTSAAIPAGEFTISSPLDGSTLQATGLNEAPADCAGPPQNVSSLAYVPTLAVSNGTPAANWRDRFAVRFKFTTGEISAKGPLHGGNDLARWDVRGPSNASRKVPLTDTLQIKIPLADSFVTFSSGGHRVKIAAIENTNRIDARLLAHPVRVDDKELAKGQAEPHFPALYALYDPIPTAAQRAELFFEDWCSPPGLIAPAVPSGPSPGKYCTGGKVVL